jgi:hypothetical protein
MISVWAGLAIATLAWIAVSTTVRLRRFFKLRGDVRSRMQDFAAVLARAKEESEAPLHEAQQVFRDLGTRMVVFTGRRGIATLPLRRMGFDPASASSGLFGLSNALPAYGIERLRWRAQVERALKLQNAHGDARMKRSRLNPLLVVLALVAIASAVWTYSANRHLHHALKTAHIVRAAIEKDTKRTRERASEAEKAKLATEQSIAEVRAQLVAARTGETATERSLVDVNAQLALTRKAKVAAELSLEKMKEQLASSESARKTSEGQLKALSDELAAIKTAKDDAERNLKAANDQLALLKAAKEDSDVAAAKAKEDLERERKAHEAAEQTPHAAPQPTP